MRQLESAPLQDAVAAALASEQHPAFDETFGLGEVHRFGRERNAALELYPGADEGLVVRFRSPVVVFALRAEAPVHCFQGDADEPGCVVFHARDNGASATLTLRDDGGLALVADQHGRRPEQRFDDHAAEQPPAATADPEPKERHERVKLTGSVLQRPAYRERDHEPPRIWFPLRGSDTETVLTVYSTKRYAEKIRALDIDQGDVVRVSGVKHSDNRVYAFGARKLEEGAKQG